MNSSTNETKNAKSGTNSNVVQFNSDERVLDAASEWLVKLDEGLDDNETQVLNRKARKFYVEEKSRRLNLNL